MKATRLPRLVAVLAAATLWTLGMGFAQAGLGVVRHVQIDDLTDTITATLNGNPITLLSPSSGEFIHFTLPSPPFPLPVGTTVSYDFLEPSGGLVSDRLLVTLFSSDLDFQFGSVPANLPPQSVVNQVGPFVENGAFQQLPPLSPNGSDVFLISVRSAVPAPPSLALLALGLAGLGFWRRAVKK